MRQARILALASLAFVFAAAGLPAAAQQPWKPTHSLKIISPYSAGGTNDLLCRLVAQKLGDALGQTVIVDNRTGANGIIGVEAVAKSPADGYTLVMASAATHAINPALYRKLPYDPVRDFTPVGLIATVPMLLVVNPSLPVSNARELVALAKSKTGTFSAGSPGVGSSPHMASELFKLASGIDSVHVAYKGDAPALADLLGGQITLMFSNMPSALPFVQSGKLKALGMTGTRRAESAPDIPTMAEAGFPEVNNSTWYGLMAPGNLPPEILARLDKELQNVLKLPEVKQTIRQLGATAEAGGAESLRQLVNGDIAKYAKVVKSAGIQQE